MRLRNKFVGQTNEKRKEWLINNQITDKELGEMRNLNKRGRTKEGEIFPLLPSELVAIPTEIVRTALFQARPRKYRKIRLWERVSSREGIQIEHFGIELDLELWLLVLCLASGKPTGKRFRVTLNELLPTHR